MIPFLQYRQELSGTPGAPTGVMELYPNRLWKRTWNDGPPNVGGLISPQAWLDAQEGIPGGVRSHHPLFTEFVQIVRVAEREGTAERDWDTETEIYSDVAEELQIAAGNNMGAWQAVTPHDQNLSTGSEVVSNVYVDDTTEHMLCRAWECKYLIRWAPPFSSRAKIRAIEFHDATQTRIDIIWDGAAGLTIGGVQRCFGAHISEPITDAMWIADPGGERVLDFEYGVWRDVVIEFATSYRNIPLPP